MKLNKPRFDRMKNDQLQKICTDLIRLRDKFDFKAMHLEGAFGVIQKSNVLTKNFQPHKANAALNSRIDEHRKRLDDLVSGLHLNIKGLSKACFKEDTDVMAHVEITAKSMLADFNQVNLLKKTSRLMDLTRIRQTDHPLNEPYTRLHLMRYVVEIENTFTRLKELESRRTKEKRQVPKGGGVQSKEALVFNLKLFMQSIQHATVLHPETDYRYLIAMIREITIPHMAQVRNLATRRKTAQLKAAQPARETEEQVG